jgi:hypothetical protein
MAYRPCGQRRRSAQATVAAADSLESRRLLAAGSGLRADYFNDPNLAEFVVSRTDAAVDFNWAGGSPHPSVGADTFSARWSGQVRPRFTETYTFHAQADDGLRLWVNGRRLIDTWASPTPAEQSATISLRAGRRYDLVMEYHENTQNASARLSWSSASQVKEVVPAAQLTPSDRGSIRVEGWDQIPGGAVSALTGDPRYPDAPAGVGSDNDFELPVNTQQQYGQRWRGYLHAPQTGAYRLWVSGDDTAELYLSNSRDPGGKRLVASVPAPTNEREWSKFPQQRSAPLRLVAGQAYYVELLHKQDSGPGHVAVGWTLPDGRFEGRVDGYNLSPLLPEVRLHVDESAA